MCEGNKRFKNNNSYNDAFHKGQQSLSQTWAVIMLIAKPGKDSQLLQNWRPIGLLNTDYKILTKVLSNRLIKVLPSIIGIHQYGFMKNRFIGEYCRIVSDVLYLIKQKKLTACLLAIDMEKAFDKII